MRNKYPGTCYRCGKHCAAGDGHFEKIGSRQWKKWGLLSSSRFLVQHANCAIKYRGTPQHYKFDNQPEKYGAAAEAV